MQLTKRERERDRRRTAYHEAGHAVVGIVLGLDIGDVTINSGKWEHREYRGLTRYKCHPFEEYSPNQIIFSLAGLMAQNRYSRNQVAIFMGGKDDYDSAVECLDHLGCPNAYGDFERATKKLINRLWPVVVEFAQLLLEFGDVKGNEVNQFIGDRVDEAKFGDFFASISNFLTFGYQRLPHSAYAGPPHINA